MASLKQEGRDQEATEHEEHVHAEKAAGKEALLPGGNQQRCGVVQDDQGDGHGPHPVERWSHPSCRPLGASMSRRQ